MEQGWTRGFEGRQEGSVDGVDKSETRNNVEVWKRLIWGWGLF